MERFTGKDRRGYYIAGDVIYGDGGDPEKFRGDAIDRLAQYEDLEEQGRLKKVVCDVGDTVWDKEVEPWDVISVEWFSRKVTHLHCVSPVTGVRNTFAVGKRSLGKTVFLSRAEAVLAASGKEG